MKESFRELVEFAPNMTQDMWDDLGNLARARSCIPAFLKYCLDLAQSEANQLVNISTATPEGQEQAALAKGASRAYTALVGNVCDLMGDLAEAEMRAEAGEEMAEVAPPRSRRKRVALPAPAAKKVRRHPAPSRRSK